MKRWIAILLGILAPYPINLLAQRVALQQAASGNEWAGYALIALVFFTYLFLGVYLGSLGNLRTTGTARRVRWLELVLGVVLFLGSAAMRLEQAAGLVTAQVDFVRENAALTAIVRFSDGLNLWVVLAGFFLADAFEKIPAQSEARVETPRAKKEKPPKAAKTRGLAWAFAQLDNMGPLPVKPSGAEPVSAQTGAVPVEASVNGASSAANQPTTFSLAQASPSGAEPAQPQPAAIAPAQASPSGAEPEQPQSTAITPVQARPNGVGIQPCVIAAEGANPVFSAPVGMCECVVAPMVAGMDDAQTAGGQAPSIEPLEVQPEGAAPES